MPIFLLTNDKIVSVVYASIIGDTFILFESKYSSIIFLKLPPTEALRYE